MKSVTVSLDFIRHRKQILFNLPTSPTGVCAGRALLGQWAAYV